MGDEACGPTFDGLNTDQIVTQATIESSNYVATNNVNQYATTASNMDIVAAATLPSFSFKNSAGNLTGELKAAKVTLNANSEMTTTGVVALTAQTTNNTAVHIKNNSVDPALTVSKMTPLVERGLGMQVTTQSVDKAVLALSNTQTSTCSLMQALAPNLPADAKASILIGKDNSTTGNSYTIGTVAATLPANNRLEVNSFGEATSALTVYKQATASTSATTGSVVVPGDLTSSTKVSSKALVLYGTSSGSATLQASAITTTPYTLTLPNSLGTNGQYLTLGNPVGNVAPLSWTTGAGANASQSAIVGRILTGSQTIATATKTALLYDSNDGNTTLASVPISYAPATGRFTNTFGNTASFLVSYHTAFTANATGIRQSWIEKNGIDTLRYGQNSAPSASASVNATIVTGAAYITIANGEYFTLFAYQTSGATLDFYSSNYDASRVQITQVPGSTVPQVNAALLGYRADGAQSIASNTGTNVFWSTTDFNVGSTGLTFNGTTTFTNNTGGTLNLLVTAAATFASNATGNRHIWIAVNSLGGRQGQVIEQAVAGDVTALSTSCQVSIPNGDFIRIFVFQMSGSNLLLTTATTVQFSPIVSSSALQSVSLTTPSPLLSISGSPAVGQNPTLSFTTTSTPTGSGTTIVLATSPSITTPTLATPSITGTMTSTGEIVATTFDGKTIKNTEQFFVKYTDFGFTGNSQVISTNASSGTFRLLVHNFANCQIKMPNATLFNIGTTYRIKNNGTSFSTAIFANDGTTLLGFSTIGGIIEIILDDNSTANGVWDIQGMLNHSSVEANNLGLYFKNGALISLANTANFKVITYTAPSQSVNYNWIYPTTAGFTGQVLTSAAGGTLTWSNPLTNQSILSISPGGNSFGTNSPSVATNPTLTITGSQSMSGPGVGSLIVNTTTFGSCLCTSFLNDYMGTNQTIYNAIGKSTSFGNSATPGFYYYGDNDIQNKYAIALYGKALSVQIFTPSISATTNQATLLVNGGITAESLYVNGATTLQATTATSITTNSLTVIPNPGNPSQTRQLTFDYGTLTPSLWWAYDAVDNTFFSPLSYPTNFNTNIANRQYSWQQVGKNYSFTLCLKASLGSNDDLECLFINDCYPPQPFFGSLSQGEFDQQNANGLMIPAS